MSTNNRTQRDPIEKTARKYPTQYQEENKMSSRKRAKEDSSDTSSERINRNISPIHPRSPNRRSPGQEYEKNEKYSNSYEKREYATESMSSRSYDRNGGPGNYRPYSRPYYSREHNGANYSSHYSRAPRRYVNGGRGGYDRYPRSYGGGGYYRNYQGYSGMGARGYYRGYARADEGYVRSYDRGYNRGGYDTRGGVHRGRGGYDSYTRPYAITNEDDYSRRSYQTLGGYLKPQYEDGRYHSGDLSERDLYRRRDEGRTNSYNHEDRPQYRSMDESRNKYGNNNSTDGHRVREERPDIRMYEGQREQRSKNESRDYYQRRDVPERYSSRRNDYHNPHSRRSRSSTSSTDRKNRSRSPLEKSQRYGSRSEYRGEYRSSGGGGDYRPAYPSSDRKDSSYDSRGYDPRSRGDPAPREDYYASSSRPARSRSPSATNTRYASQER